jgi:hypothetical protein
MQGYTLYQTFSSAVEKRKLGKKRTETVLKSIKSMSDDQLEAVFRLIIEHARLDNIDVTDEEGEPSIPYQGEIRGRGPRFSLENFPNQLQWIIFKFCEVCNKSHVEDAEADPKPKRKSKK